MARKILLACLPGLFFAVLISAQSNRNAPAQNQGQTRTATPAGNSTDSATDDLPEEDEALKPKVYPFNPLEADRNIKVGNFYMRQANARGYRAAAGRFQDATKYNPGSAEAFFRLGEAEEKLKHADKAKAAFQRVMQIAPESKLGSAAKKKVAGLG